mgnify:CR=1 FL=1
MDNGADHVMSPFRSHFLSFGPSMITGIQVAGKDMVLPVLGEGTIVFDLGGGKMFPIPKCLYVPDLVGPLLSVSVLESMGLTTVLGPDSHFVLDQQTQEIVLEIEKHSSSPQSSGLYYLPYDALDFSTGPRGAAMAVSGSKTNSSKGDWSLWHSRLGHLSEGDLSTLQTHQAVTGATFTSTRPPKTKCFFCLDGKMAQTPFQKSGAKIRPGLLSLLHMDLMGPMDVDSVRGFRYILVVVDDFSRYCWIRCLKTKDEAETYLMEDIFPLAERRLDRKILSFRSDRGGEFLSARFSEWCNARGISHNLTAPYTPQQNGLAEVSNRILQEKMRSMLAEAGLPLRYWEFAVRYACWVKNRSPAAALTAGETPHSVMFGSKPSIAMARVFGCLSQVWVPPPLREGKLKPRARWGIFLGIAQGSKAWEFLMLDRNSLFISRNAYFHEDLFWPKWKRYMSDRGELQNFAVEMPHSVFPLGEDTRESVDPPDADAEEGVVSGGIAQESYVPAADDALPQNSPMLPTDASEHPSRSPSMTSESMGESEFGDKSLGSVEGEQGSIPADSDLGSEADHLLTPEAEETRLPGFGLGGPTMLTPVAEADVPSEAAELVGETSLPGPLLPTEVVTDSRFAERYPVRNRRPVGGGRSDGGGSYRGYAHLATKAARSTPSALCRPVEGKGAKTPNLYYKEPTKYKEAVADEFAAEWMKAMDKEMAQIRERGVFKLVDRKPGMKLMTGKWVYKVKRNLDGTLEKFKCRFCIQGFKADPGIHYNETYAPTAEMSTARLLLALATVLGWEVDQMDVAGAFLYGLITEEIYMLPPEGYEDGSGKVWKLEKALYGLKQAPRQWNQKLNEVLTSLSFKQSCLDPSLYILEQDGTVLFLLDFVDDMLLVSPSKRLVDSVKKGISEKFEMSDLGASKKYLGWHIRRDREKKEMWLSVEMKIMDTVRTFGQEHAECPATPLPNGFQTFLPHEMDPGNPERKPEEGSDDKFSPLLTAEEHCKYRSLVGSLQYFAQSLRPDVAYAANCLAQASNQPRQRHWKAALYALRYLKGTAQLCVHYSAAKGSQLVCYSDSDYAGCHGSRKSTSGVMCMLAGGPISWKSKKQSVVTLSTTEAEFRALTSAVTECMWLRSLLAEFGQKVNGPTPVYCDNEGAVKLSRNPVHRAKTKHVAVSFEFVRQEQTAGKVHVIYVPTNKQAADFLTKRVQPAQFLNCVNLCGQTVQK